MSEPGGAASNVAAIGAALDNPSPAPVMAEAGDNPPRTEDDGRGRPPLDPSCPIRPLGLMADISGSQRCYYLDVNNQLVGLEANRGHGTLGLIAMFGPQSDWLEAHFPRWSKPKKEYDKTAKEWVEVPGSSVIVGFDYAEAARALVEECSRKGAFDPAGRMRGRGAHVREGGGMVFHYGDKLLATTQRVDGGHKGWVWRDPGLFEGNVYPNGVKIPRPWHDPVSDEPAHRLLGLLQTWRWRRKLIDPRFLLGWIGAAMIGGALDWRPNIWITGDRGTGKSTLNGEGKTLHQLFGDGLFTTAQASAAAIRQTLKNATLPVLFDEIEASADNRRVNEIVELARISSSGGSAHRGGADHQAHEFKLKSCFQFSSILIPPLEPQDRSRLCILELLPFSKGDQAPDLSRYRLPELGQQLQRRMIDGWARLCMRWPTRLGTLASKSTASLSWRFCRRHECILSI